MSKALPFEVPPQVSRCLAGASWAEVGHGCTAAAVYRFDNGLYLKALERAPLDPVFGSLAGERARLVALRSRVPVPEVIAYEQDETRDFLVLSELPGCESSSPPAGDAVRARVRELARACRQFHGATTRDFPFHESSVELRQVAARRTALGLIDTADFDRERQGKAPQELLAELHAIHLGADDLVLAHGDLCLPNIILNEDRLSGFVDVGRASVSDRWRDLALCLRGIQSSWGSEARELFLREYGIEVDLAKLHFYTLLDEFF